MKRFSTWMIAICVFTCANAQHMFEEIAMADKQESFFNNGYREWDREVAKFQKHHNNHFQKMRKEQRRPPQDWGLGEDLVQNAIYMGELTCQNMMSFGNELDLNYMNPRQMKIRRIYVVDESTGENYPVKIQGLDFVVYNPNLSEVEKRRFIKITVEHEGCYQMRNSCWAKSTFHSSYAKPNQVEQLHAIHHKYLRSNFHRQHMPLNLKFTHLNLANKSYETECTLWSRIFNFWPLNNLFFN